MGFFKKLFIKDEPFIPTPTQRVSGLEPIVVQAIENLYPNIEDQKQVFEYSLKYHEESKKAKPLALLSLLSYSNGKIENLVDLDSPDLDLVIYHIMVDYGFSDMKAAEKWVKSTTKSQT
jgi:hypothetical protein